MDFFNFIDEFMVKMESLQPGTDYENECEISMEYLQTLYDEECIKRFLINECDTAEIVSSAFKKYCDDQNYEVNHQYGCIDVHQEGHSEIHHQIMTSKESQQNQPEYIDLDDWYFMKKYDELDETINRASKLHYKSRYDNVDFVNNFGVKNAYKITESYLSLCRYRSDQNNDILNFCYRSDTHCSSSVSSDSKKNAAVSMDEVTSSTRVMTSSCPDITINTTNDDIDCTTHEDISFSHDVFTTNLVDGYVEDVLSKTNDVTSKTHITSETNDVTNITNDITSNTKDVICKTNDDTSKTNDDTSKTKDATDLMNAVEKSTSYLAKISYEIEDILSTKITDDPRNAIGPLDGTSLCVHNETVNYVQNKEDTNSDDGSTNHTDLITDRIPYDINCNLIVTSNTEKVIDNSLIHENDLREKSPREESTRNPEEKCVNSNQERVTNKNESVSSSNQEGVCNKNNYVTSKEKGVSSNKECVPNKNICALGKKKSVKHIKKCVTSKKKCIISKPKCVTSSKKFVTSKQKCMTSKKSCVNKIGKNVRKECVANYKKKTSDHPGDATNHAEEKLTTTSKNIKTIGSENVIVRNVHLLKPIAVSSPGAESTFEKSNKNTQSCNSSYLTYGSKMSNDADVSNNAPSFDDQILPGKIEPDADNEKDHREYCNYTLRDSCDEKLENVHGSLENMSFPFRITRIETITMEQFSHQKALDVLCNPRQNNHTCMLNEDLLFEGRNEGHESSTTDKSREDDVDIINISREDKSDSNIFKADEGDIINISGESNVIEVQQNFVAEDPPCKLESCSLQVKQELLEDLEYLSSDSVTGRSSVQESKLAVLSTESQPWNPSVPLTSKDLNIGIQKKKKHGHKKEIVKSLTEKSYTCKTCGKTYKRHDFFQRHVEDPNNCANRKLTGRKRSKKGKVPKKEMNRYIKFM